VGVAILLGAVIEIAREALSKTENKLRWVAIVCLGT
jgi:hypothetical protein